MKGICELIARPVAQRSAGSNRVQLALGEPAVLLTISFHLCQRLFMDGASLKAPFHSLSPVYKCHTVIHTWLRDTAINKVHLIKRNISSDTNNTTTMDREETSQASRFLLNSPERVSQVVKARMVTGAEEPYPSFCEGVSQFSFTSRGGAIEEQAGKGG